MKLEVGMYVRTDGGIIGKIYEKIGDMFTYEDSNRDYITYGLTHNEILKASFNIIDLIEVGDYVNGYPVKSKFGSNGVCLNINYQKQGIEQIVKEQDIKSIVTREAFSNVEYKVVE